MKLEINISSPIYSRDGLTALHCAAARGHTEALETLIGLCGARVDVADSHGCTPLHYAAALGHADATAALLQHAADPHRQDRRGRSPAHTAAAKGQLETVRMLGARGANLWLRNSKGDLPLHEAVASGRRELVKWLLDGRPSQVNATNHEGRTPLHIAAATDNADLCRLLLDRGAEVNPVARSSKNEPLTPLDCATARGHRSTAKYLQMHGGLPASKLTDTQIVIDGAPITGLPSRRVTSTKIDVRDRIRIEKREVVELSSPIQERRRFRRREDTNSASDSSPEERKTSRKESGAKYSNRHHERRRRMVEPQRSFSDGYDSDYEMHGKLTRHSHDRKHKRSTKKNRSRSEPCSKKSGSEYSSEKHYHKYKSGSDSSSVSRSRSGKKRYKRNKTHHKRKSSSDSESSSSGSSDRRATKRRGKKTSIHIKTDDEKQSVNIVNFKGTEEVIIPDKSNETVDKSEQLKEEEENNSSKSKLQSETETDTVSLKANMVVTEAQIHVARDSSQRGSSEITVTMDSSNNVSIEAANMSVTHKEIRKSFDEKESTNTESPKNEVTENVEGKNLSAEATTEEKNDRDTLEDTTKVKSDPEILSLPSNEKTAQDESAELLAVERQTNEKQIDIESQKKSIDSANLEQKTEDVDNVIQQDSMKKATIDNSLSQDSRKRSFQVLSGPDETISGSEAIAGTLSSIEDSENKTESNKKSEVKSSRSSPVVSFAAKDEVFESKDSDKSADHLMGEKVTPTESCKHMQDGTMESQNDTQKTETDGNNAIIVDEKRKEYASTTASSTEITQSLEADTDTMSKDKGLVSVIESHVPIEDRAVQQVILESVPDDVNFSLSQSPHHQRKLSKDSQANSRKGSLYETESYKVLTDFANAADGGTGILKKSNKSEGASLDDIKRSVGESDKYVKDSFDRVPSVSDNEIYSHSEANGRRKRFRKKSRAKSRTTIRSKSENSERGYESSGLMDSGFEPSPRAVQRTRIMSPRLTAYYQQRNASGRYSGKSDSRIPVRKPGDKYAVDMKSVTQRIQTNMRRYYCERKIFQHLLELKRLQIRTSKTNEAVLVKRAIDEYNKSSLANVGLGSYNSPDYTFSSFEKFLYDSLRKLQKSSKKHLDNLPEAPIDFDYGESELYRMSGVPDNPCLCTSKTHRCFHAVHAYTGIPCSAYIPYKWNHHTMPKPSTAGGAARSKGFLPKINSKPPTGAGGKAHVTLEVSHGSEKQLIALPAERLDRNKRYYVTFTVKGSEPPSDDNGSPGASSKVGNTG
ncbi:Ankyrin repeat, PH and SEC7 domain containing protein secG [Eumeta japonica]|uniref:Ankyrin repeat, PH and SEC7 domain containing protein secG n=1 Tax=Eumeta variegata TaxID=151549 RepID=A0A4C1XG47_EUMVA|nr:Ankyrin repeat, PH and SEC7 domain containing protein secG [Eumeta japonica]